MSDPRNTPVYELVVTDLAGTTKTLLESPADIKISRQWQDYSVLTFTVQDSDDVRALELQAYRRAVKVYRGQDNSPGILALNARVIAPLVETPDGLEVTCADPFWELTRRLRQTQAVFAGMDKGDVARSLVIDENARKNLFLDSGALGDGPAQATIDRKYNVGINVGESVRELTKTADALHFTIDPIETGAGDIDTYKMAELNILTAGTTGTDLSASVKFEYGVETLDNCEYFRREDTKIINHVMMYGQKIGDFHVFAEAEDTDSQDEYGILENSYSRPHVGSTSFLQHIADSAIVADPCAIWTLTPGPESPSPFVDFDAGDTVLLRVKYGRHDFATPMRVNGFTVEVDNDSGEEKLSELQVEA